MEIHVFKCYKKVDQFYTTDIKKFSRIYDLNYYDAWHFFVCLSNNGFNFDNDVNCNISNICHIVP